MLRKRKKVTKKRGTRYVGRGYNDRNRGAGNRGGRGKAGSGKRGDSKKPTFINQKRKFGRHGFKSVPQRLNKKEKLTLNLSQLENFADYYVEKGIFEKENDMIKADLTKLGVQKLLGKGNVKRKWHIIVEEASKKAIEKINKSGKIEVLKTSDEE